MGWQHLNILYIQQSFYCFAEDTRRQCFGIRYHSFDHEGMEVIKFGQLLLIETDLETKTNQEVLLSY
jgi:hypothetical protein